MLVDFRNEKHETYVTKFDPSVPNRVEVTLDGKVYVVTNRVGTPNEGVTKEELRDMALGILFKLQPYNVAPVVFEEAPPTVVTKTEIEVPAVNQDGTANEPKLIQPKSRPYGGPKIVPTGKGVK